MEERSIEEINFSEPPAKMLIMSNKEYPQQTAEITSAVDPLLITNEENHNENVISLRHPPALKAAVKNRGQSLLKSNPANVQSTNISISTSTTAASTTTTTITVDDSKRMWKCKRCNFKDSNKDTVLSHVKSHYEVDQNANEERVSSIISI